MHRRMFRARVLWAAALVAAFAGCQKAQPGPGSGASAADAGAGPSAEASGEPTSTAAAAVAAHAEPPSDKPLLGITAFVATIYKEPRDTSKKLGYLRAGSKVVRSADPAGKAGCSGGWY